MIMFWCESLHSHLRVATHYTCLFQSGVRSEGGNHVTRGALNIHTGEDDDDRLIM